MDKITTDLEVCPVKTGEQSRKLKTVFQANHWCYFVCDRVTDMVYQHIFMMQALYGQ